MPSYDALRYDPPAPIAQVTLRASDGATAPNVLLLIDTGADITLLPRGDILRLGVTPDPALRPERLPRRLRGENSPSCLTRCTGRWPERVDPRHAGIALARAR